MTMRLESSKPFSVGGFRTIRRAWNGSQLPIHGVDLKQAAQLQPDDALPPSHDAPSDEIRAIHVVMDDGSRDLTIVTDAELRVIESGSSTLATVLEDEDGHLIVEPGDYGAVDHATCLDSPLKALELFAAAGVVEVEWVRRGDGSAGLTRLRGDEVEIDQGRRIAMKAPLSITTISPDATADNLLIQLGATVMNGAELASKPDEPPFERMKVAFAFDINGDVSEVMVQADSRAYQVVMRQDDDSWKAEYLGERPYDLPPFTTVSEVAGSHGIECELLNHSQFAFHATGVSVNRADDFVADLKRCGWDVADAEDQGRMPGHLIVDVAWKGRSWSWSHVSNSGEEGPELRFDLSGECPAENEDEAMRYAMRESNGGAVARFATRSCIDGSSVVMYNAGNGWCEGLAEAYRMPNVKTQGMARE